MQPVHASTAPRKQDLSKTMQQSALYPLYSQNGKINLNFEALQEIDPTGSDVPAQCAILDRASPQVLGH